METTTKIRYVKPTLFARKEPTTDKVMFQKKSTGKKDLCLYFDKGAQHLACRIPWYGVSIRRSNKNIWYNTQKHNLVWL